ncbi:MAG: serine hydrolase [Caulobacterales bacterium]|nr:serine hydrolase [Caulobacterales bacterium]
MPASFHPRRLPHPLPRLLPLLLGAAILPLAGCGTIRRTVATPTNLVSHQLCSAAFVSHIDPERFYEEAVVPDVAPVKGLIRHHVDLQRQEVTATFAGGLAQSRAVFRGDTGCVVVQGPLPPAPHDQGPRTAALAPPIAGPDVVTPSDPRLAAALDHVFAQPASGPRRYVRAVVVMQDGRIVAERYGPGYGPDTVFTGWSMTKSVTNALLGILVRQGKLDMAAPAPLAAWADAKNPRHAVTPDNLLRMVSGLDVGDSLEPGVHSAFDVAARAQFARPDMATAFVDAKVQAPPGQRFRYADGSTLLLSRIIRQEAGGTGQDVLLLARRELFDKLGMTHTTLEEDASGTPIGASHMWASARDWARFGQLYLDDGVAGGERILPAGWVDYSARLTPGSEAIGYGAGWWTNRGGSDGARHRPHLPTDSFLARGSHGQFTIVIPSARVVIVKLGDAYTPYGDMAAMDRFTGEVLAALGR